MVNRVILAAFIAVALGADEAGEKAMLEELGRLAGTWRFTSLELEGTALPEAAYLGSKIIVEEDSFKTISGGITYSGTVKVDVSTSPKTINLMFTDGPEKGNVSLGIYELKGDDWKICLGLTGKDRPKTFVTTPGSGHALETLKRKKSQGSQ